MIPEPKSRLFVAAILHPYSVDLVRALIADGHELRAAEVSRLPGYWPARLDALVGEVQPRLVYAEDFHTPERFEEICDPDVSVISLEFFERIAYYEKMFLLTTDRLAFWPISQVDRCRLFYRYVAHFYKIFREERITAVLFDSFPHGLAEIAIFGLAKALGHKTAYLDWPGFSADFATVETEIHPRRPTSRPAVSLTQHDANARRFREPLLMEPVWNSYQSPHRLRVLAKTIVGLVLRSPLRPYRSNSGFFLNRRRARIRHVIPLIKYYRRMRRAERYYDKYAVDVLPPGDGIAFFLHMQPESTTLPQGSVFGDQLLAFDLILQAIPAGYKIFIKEHPHMYSKFGEDSHDRSDTFYQHLRRDPRVVFVKRSMSSEAVLRRCAMAISINGTISWEAMRQGKPSVIFGWAWFSGCDSCYVVDSVEELRRAFANGLTKTSAEVRGDVERFLTAFSERLVRGVPNHFALPFTSSDLDYGLSVRNIALALSCSLESGSKLSGHTST